MAETQIISMIDGVREFPVRLSEKKVKIVTLEPGRNHIEDSIYKVLLKNKGFKKMLENGQLEEPSKNAVKTDSDKLKTQKAHSAEIEKLKKSLDAEHDKVLKAKDAEFNGKMAEMSKKLENSNDSLIAVTAELEKAKSDLAILKKAKQQ